MDPDHFSVVKQWRDLFDYGPGGFKESLGQLYRDKVALLKKINLTDGYRLRVDRNPVHGTF